MALGDPYITGTILADYMDEIDLDEPDDAGMENDLQSAAEAASREINQITGRDFNKAETPSARLYIPKAPGYVKTDDIYTTAGLVIQVMLNGDPVGDPLAADDYELFPLNGIVDGNASPYTGFRASSYLRTYHRIQVTARWGWEEVPPDIIQAAKIRAAELFKLRDAPLGVVNVGSGSANYTNKARPVPHWKSMALHYARTERKLYLG